MAILTVNRTFEQENLFVGDDGAITFRELYIVTSDSMTEKSSTVQVADGLPRLGDRHDDNGNAILQSIDVSHRDDKPFAYDVQFEYSTALLTAMGAAPSVSYGAAKTQELMDVDLDGFPITNSAGNVFNPGVTRDVTRPTLSITRNELWNNHAFPLHVIVQYYDTVNEFDWPDHPALDFVPPGQAKMASITAVKVVQNGAVYWSVSYEIHFSRKRWDFLEILDRGVEELDITPGVGGAPDVVNGWKPYYLPDDVIGVEPKLLNGAGLFLTAAQAHGNPNPPNPIPPQIYFRRLRPYEKIDWSPLNLEFALMGIATPFSRGGTAPPRSL